MDKNEMVYDHTQEDYCLATNMSEAEQNKVAEQLATITKGYKSDDFKMSQVTELVDKALTEKEKTFVVAMYIKLVTKMMPYG